MSETTLSEKAYQNLRQKVFSGELQAGDRLVNRTLASEMGMSFIPVREAIKRLSSEGVVEQVPGAGAFVRKIGRQELAQLYDVRELFEPYAAAQAARHITDYELADLWIIMRSWAATGEEILTNAGKASAEQMGRWLRHDEQFHQILIKASRNIWLEKIMNDLSLISLCFQAQRENPDILNPAVINEALRSHAELLNLLEAGDAEGAASMVRVQLNKREEVLAYI